MVTNTQISRFKWQRGLWRGFAAAPLLGLWVRIPPGAWMSVSCECRVFSGDHGPLGLLRHGKIRKPT